MRGSRQSEGAISGSREPGPSGPGPSGFDPGRLASLSFVLPYDDGDERLSVAYDSRSEYWPGQVLIGQYGSDDRIIYVELADLNWLIGALKLVAIAMEARQGGDGETRPHPKDDSAGPKDIARNEGQSVSPLSNEEKA